MTTLMLLIILRVVYVVYAIILCDNKVWQWYLNAFKNYNNDFSKITKIYENYYAKSDIVYDIFSCSYNLTKWRLKDFCLDKTMRKEIFGE